MYSKILIFMAAISLCACTSTGAAAAGEKLGCIQRTTDGPWKRVGKQIPREQVIAQKFAEGGEAALLKLLGVPFAKSADETTWVYESRRESLHVWCDPPEQVHKHDQAFTIVRVTDRDGKLACEIEGKEFVGNAILTADAAIKQPRSPLGFEPHRCGAAAK